MALLRVVCVKWGDKYGPEWVYKLRSMVQRHLSVPHVFVCMTDSPIPDVDCVTCPDDLPGWWAKIGLFEPGKFPGANLYLDLDVVITGDISGILDCGADGRVTAPDDFSYSILNVRPVDPHTRKLLGGDGTINSSVLLWRGGDGREVWEDFDRSVMDELHGDQNWITRTLWPDKINLLPDRWVRSYKYHVMRGGRQAPITVFHGNPKVTELPDFDPLRVAWS